MNGHGQTDAKRVRARVGEEAEQKDSLGAVGMEGGHMQSEAQGMKK